MDDKFDAIVVGAGPAGSAAALVMARAGLSVMLIERGDPIGSKGVIGGVLYSHVLNELIPNFWEEAPVERFITRRIITFLSKDSGFSFDFKTANWAQAPFNGFSVLRARFDPWFAGKAAEAGAELIPGFVVDDLLYENGKVAGIKAGGDELPAHVVIAADGTNSFLAQKAGLRRELRPDELATSNKLVIELPPEVIEERFNLAGDEGTSNEYVGYCTQGLEGGAFLYTNKDSISLGLVCKISALYRNAYDRQLKMRDMIEDFRLHPLIRDLVRGGNVAEYSACMLPEGGRQAIPQLYTDGMLVAGNAAGFVNNAGWSFEGANFAISSGAAAGQAVIRAKERGDFSAATLSHYETLLQESYVLQDFETFRRAPHFLDNQRLYSLYPDLLNGFAEKLFTVTGAPKQHMLSAGLAHMRQSLRGKASIWQIIRDGLEGARAI